MPGGACRHGIPNQEKPMRSLQQLRLLALSALLLTLSVATPLRGQQPAEAASDEQVQQWIHELGARRFIVREDATLQLVEAGNSVIAAVEAAISEQNVEGLARTMFVLDRLASSDDLATAQAAREALGRLSQHEGNAVSRRAIRALATLDQRREEKSIRELRSLGASFGNQYVVVGNDTMQLMVLSIADNWRGTTDDLVRLKWITNLQHLDLIGEHVTDEWMQYVEAVTNLSSLALKRTSVTASGIGMLVKLEQFMNLDVKYGPMGDATLEHLVKIRTLRYVKLYGTAVTLEAAEKFAADQPQIELDFRLGAFLGVACPRAPEPCYVRSVQSDTAAERAGMRAGDLIIEFGGVVIRDFDDLKKQIGRHRPGDKTTLVLIRPGPLQSTSLRKAEETEFDLKAEDHALGIEITDIDEDSAWYKVGMRAGDVINVLNNESVKTAAEAMEAFKKIAAGEVVNIVFYRKPDKRPASITFGAWK